MHPFFLWGIYGGLPPPMECRHRASMEVRRGLPPELLFLKKRSHLLPLTSANWGKERLHGHQNKFFSIGCLWSSANEIILFHLRPKLTAKNFIVLFVTTGQRPTKKSGCWSTIRLLTNSAVNIWTFPLNLFLKCNHCSVGAALIANPPQNNIFVLVA